MLVLRDIACNKLAAQKYERQYARWVLWKYMLQNFTQSTTRNQNVEQKWR